MNFELAEAMALRVARPRVGGLGHDGEVMIGTMKEMAEEMAKEMAKEMALWVVRPRVGGMSGEENDLVCCTMVTSRKRCGMDGGKGRSGRRTVALLYFPRGAPRGRRGGANGGANGHQIVSRWPRACARTECPASPTSYFDQTCLRRNGLW